MRIGSVYPRCQWMVSKDHPLRIFSLHQAARELIKAKAADKAANLPAWASSDRTKVLESIVADKHRDALNVRAMRVHGPDVVELISHEPGRSVVTANRRPEWGLVTGYESLGWDESRRDYRRIATFEDGSVLEWGVNAERGRTAGILFGRAPEGIESR